MSENDLVESTAYEDIKRKRGAPKGSANRKRSHEFLTAMKRAIAKDLGDGNYRRGLNRVASRLVQAAMDGESWAMQEITNRIDGKPVQPVERDDSQPLAIFEGRVRLIPVLVDATQQPTVIEHNAPPIPADLPAIPDESKG